MKKYAMILIVLIGLALCGCAQTDEDIPVTETEGMSDLSGDTADELIIGVQDHR